MYFSYCFKLVVGIIVLSYWNSIAILIVYIDLVNNKYFIYVLKLFINYNLEDIITIVCGIHK
jgi:hypothetical protein